MSVAAVVIIRRGSVRIPNKNYQWIGGEPLYLRKVRQLIRLKKLITNLGQLNVFVGSDDKTIRETVEEEGAYFFHRKPEFCDEKSVSVNDVVRDALSQVGGDHVLWAHCTNPFLNESHYNNALDLYKHVKREGYDSVYGANALQGHFWFNNRPINHWPLVEKHRVASCLPRIQEQHGGLFIRLYEDMIMDGRFIGNNPYCVEHDKWDGWDINEPMDLEIARMINDKR